VTISRRLAVTEILMNWQNSSQRCFAAVRQLRQIRRLNPSQTGRYSTNLARRDGRLSLPTVGDLLHTEMVYPPAGGHASKY